MMNNRGSVVLHIPRQIEWVNVFFLLAVHVLGIWGVIHATQQFVWQSLVFTAVFFVARAISITAGYHRLFSHPTYKCARVVQWFYLLCGAASFQNSIIAWAADHRAHHMWMDSERDPYPLPPKSGFRAFVYAHIGWVFQKRIPDRTTVQRDLLTDPLTRFQDRFYKWIALFVGIIFPVACGFLWGDPGGMFLLACASLALQYQMTFSVNSFAHLGWEPVPCGPFQKFLKRVGYFLLVAFSFGEAANHDRHHDTPDHHQSGAWYDPAGWFIRLLRVLGLASDLK